MSQIRIDSICNTPFWDSNETWDTDSPRLTPCFVNTALVWTPSLILWIFLPYTLFDYYRSKRPTISWNCYNIFKLIVSVVLALISAVHGVYVIVVWNNQDNSSNNNNGTGLEHLMMTSSGEEIEADLAKAFTIAEMIAVAVTFFTYVILLVYIHLQRVCGFVNGGVIWFYLLFQIIFSAISMHSIHLFRAADQIVFSYIELACLALLFVLCSLTDRVDNINQLMSSSSLYGKDGLLLDNDSSDDRPNPMKTKPNKLCPKETASFPSKLGFFWYDSIAYRGFRHTLTIKDLWQIRLTDRSINLFRRFNYFWKNQAVVRYESVTKNVIPVLDKSKEHFGEEKCKNPFTGKNLYSLDSNGNNLPNKYSQDYNPEQASNPTQKINIMSILGKMFWFYFLTPSLARLVTDLLQLVNPTILKLMISFTSNNTEPFWHGMIYALAFVLTNVFTSITSAYHQHRMVALGMRIRTSLIGAIYRKSLVLASNARKDYTTGEIVNLMAVDAQRFIDLLPWLCFLWTAPLQVGIALYLLWIELGPSVIGGLVLMILFIPINGYIAGMVKKIQTKQMKLKDNRLKSLNEMLSGMKVLKLYAWEEAFLKNIEKIRKDELQKIKLSGLITTVYVCISSCSPFLVSCLTFAIYIFSDSNNHLTAEKAFVSISLFNLLRIPLAMIPNMMSSLIMTLVSAKRLNKFLNSSEITNYVSRNIVKDDAITISDAAFSWESNEENINNKNKNNNILSNINMNVPKGSLVAVVGNVGSGKSSLLYALLGDMQKKSGKVNISGDLQLAYVAQQAWIQNSTVQENILFGSENNSSKYNKVIEACALKSDFEMLPGGDQTEIGEKGINLSGGQKQRVSIARACYADADLYLFDDPLSAVDSHVGKHIFDEVLSNQTGILKGKTRILVTNALYMLTDVDLIVLLKNGTIEAIGNYNELMQKSNVFSELINNFGNSADAEETKKENEEKKKMLIDAELEKLGENKSKIFDRSESRISVISELHESTLDRPPNPDTNTDKSKLVDAEKMETGQISFAVFKKFLLALSPTWSFMIAANYVLTNVTMTGSNFWLSAWTADPDQSASRINYRLLIYFVIGIAQVFFVCVAWTSIIYGTMRASGTLHTKLVNSIMHAPMHFFDTTPLGRILNRFSKDIDILDNGMTMTCRIIVNTTLQVIATLLIVSFNTPLFILIVIPFIILYILIQRFYVTTSRQLQRLESVTRSPIYTHFSETINGVSTIKAYNVCDRFIKESDDRVDQNQCCYYPNAVSNCWLQVRIEFLSNILIFFAAFFAAYSKISSNSLNGSETGLSLSYALNITMSLNVCVRMYAMFENNIVSVERISEYTDVPPEADWHKKTDSKLPSDWPQEGVIKFENYGTRYRPGLDLVVKGIDLSIKKGEKIGIVGRTGAGKSSLTLALFRIIEASMGKITMDNVDISTLGLQQLRSRITIIPQDPVLFCGTIRINLDPFSQHTDQQLWTVLELSHLKSFVSSLELGLEHAVSESGENLSVGQRQLICLARALLRRTNVLVLDEATAAVDLETDSLIQATIRKEFAHCTVLTIAHRLNTILDSDRVLVMDAGRVDEFDSPKTLLNNPSSSFYSLAKDAGIV